jgi:hypothetical protein
LTESDAFVLYKIAGVNHDELVKLAESHFSGLRSTYEEQDKVETCRFSGSEVWLQCDNLIFSLETY